MCSGREQVKNEGGNRNMKIIVEPGEIIDIINFLKNNKQISMKTVNELVKTLDKESIKKICDVIDDQDDEELPF